MCYGYTVKYTSYSIMFFKNGLGRSGACSTVKGKPQGNENLLTWVTERKKGATK